MKNKRDNGAMVPTMTPVRADPAALPRRVRPAPAPAQMTRPVDPIPEIAPLGTGGTGSLDVDRLRADLRRVQNVGAAAGAFHAAIVTTEIRQAYRTALLARDEAAAYLHGRYSWSPEDVGEVICGQRHHPDGSVRTIVEWTDRPAHLGDAAHELLRRQQTAIELRELLSDARDTTVRHFDYAVLPLPDGALDRVHKATGVVRFARYHLDMLVAGRDIGAAALVVHHGWDLAEVAWLAEVEPAAIEAAFTAARLSPPMDADSLAVRELTALIAALRRRIGHWETAREEAVAECLALGMDPRVVAARTGGPDVLVPA